ANRREPYQDPIIDVGPARQFDEAPSHAFGRETARFVEAPRAGVVVADTRGLPAANQLHPCSPAVPEMAQHVSSGDAHTPKLHQVARVWCVPFGHGQQTGEQSMGSVHADPEAPFFQFRYPETDAHVASTFSLMLSIEFASVTEIGLAVQLAAGGTVD